MSNKAGDRFPLIIRHETFDLASPRPIALMF